jgi:hypothetical protein
MSRDFEQFSIAAICLHSGSNYTESSASQESFPRSAGQLIFFASGGTMPLKWWHKRISRRNQQGGTMTDYRWPLLFAANGIPFPLSRSQIKAPGERIGLLFIEKRRTDSFFLQNRQSLNCTIKTGFGRFAMSNRDGILAQGRLRPTAQGEPSYADLSSMPKRHRCG